CKQSKILAVGILFSEACNKPISFKNSLVILVFLS
ncbi:mCG1042810, partial [Mus musculus]